MGFPFKFKSAKINRRQLLKSFFLGSVSFLTLKYLISCTKKENDAGVTTPAPTYAPVSQTISVGTGVAVPSQFLGMHFHYWPHCYTNGNTISPAPSLSPAPSFNFGTWRSHDYFGGFNNNAGNNSSVFRWLNLHTASNQTTNNSIWSAPNSAWTELDSVIQTHHNAGRDIYFTVYGTPTWAARTGFSIGGQAPSAPPQNLSDLANFITALVTRYNTTTVFATKTPIQYLEIWNEPQVRRNSAVTYSGATLTWSFAESSGYTGAGLPIAHGDRVLFTTNSTLPTGLSASTVYYVVNVTGATFFVSSSPGGSAITLSGGAGTLTAHYLSNFFWGTSTDMVAIAKTIYQAAKAVDPNIIVTSPGFTGGLDSQDNDITSFLTASDGSGGKGANWIDALACHPYNTTVDTTTAVPQLSYTIQTIKSLMMTAGLPASTPWLISEQGWMTNNTYMAGDTENNQALKIARHAVISAASGAQKHIFYVFDEDYLGTPTLIMNSNLKQTQFNWIHQNICGQTITECHILTDSTVKVTLGNGQTYHI